MSDGQEAASRIFHTTPEDSRLRSVPPQASRRYRRMLRRGLLCTGAGTTLVLGGYLGYRLWKEHRAAAGAASSEGAGGSSGGSAPAASSGA